MRITGFRRVEPTDHKLALHEYNELHIRNTVKCDQIKKVHETSLQRVEPNDLKCVLL